MRNVKKNKLLLIFPPQWTPISPHYALPALLGQLKANGYSANAMDLNIEFFNEMLTKDMLEYSIFKARNIYSDLKKNLLSVFSPDKKANDYTLDEQIFLYRYNFLKNYFLNSIPRDSRPFKIFFIAPVISFSSSVLSFARKVIV